MIAFVGFHVLNSDIVVIGSQESSHWHLGSQVEWSIDIKAKLSVCSCGSSLLNLVGIEDFPHLISTVFLSLANTNIIAFSIIKACLNDSTVLDIVEDFLLHVIFEELPPLRIGACNNHVV